MSLTRKLTKNNRFGRKTLKKAKIIDKVSSGGKIFSVAFVKKADGSIREMTCRTGVKKYLKGGESTTKHLPNLVQVTEINKGYRSFYIDSIKEIKGCGEVYTF